MPSVERMGEKLIHPGNKTVISAKKDGKAVVNTLDPFLAV